MSASARSSYHWLVKVLSAHALITAAGIYLMAIGLPQMTHGMRHGCHVGCFKTAGVLTGCGLLLVCVAALAQAVLSSACYFLYRLLDHPPHRFRGFAIVLLAAYLPWPIWAILLL